MHKAILSIRERKMLRQFLENEEKGKGFRMLKLRIKRNYPQLTKDYDLIRLVKEKL